MFLTILGLLVVSVVTKIRILKQITTSLMKLILLISCICSNKDKNFKANHNLITLVGKMNEVVSVVTKIRILKQITTTIKEQMYAHWLYL